MLAPFLPAICFVSMHRILQYTRRAAISLRHRGDLLPVVRASETASVQPFAMRKKASRKWLLAPPLLLLLMLFVRSCCRCCCRPHFNDNRPLKTSPPPLMNRCGGHAGDRSRSPTFPHKVSALCISREANLRHLNDRRLIERHAIEASGLAAPQMRTRSSGNAIYVWRRIAAAFAS